MRILVEWLETEDIAGPYWALLPWWEEYSVGLYDNDMLNESLAPWGALYTEDQDGGWLEFDRDADATVFLLRWS